MVTDDEAAARSASSSLQKVMSLAAAGLRVGGGRVGFLIWS